MIKQIEYCDLCEIEFGEGSALSEIAKEKDRPFFPQLIWTYCRKGLQIVKDPLNKHILKSEWLGGANRIELCSDHAKRFNTLLKGFRDNHTELSVLLDKMQDEDDDLWAEKQSNIRAEYNALDKELK